MTILDELELSVRARNVLRRMGTVNTIEDFMALTRGTVMLQPSAGARTWKEIRDLQTALSCPPTPPWDHVMPRASEMSLRDAAALAALKGILASYDPPDLVERLTPGKASVSGAAWTLADAFIAAREAESNGQDDL